MVFDEGLKVSFIIPAFNEERHIELCVTSIQRVCEAEKITPEIILVDNGSTDKTSELVSEKVDILCSLERCFPSKARNAGAKVASHSILAFIDGDVELTPSWAETLHKYASELNDSKLILAGYRCSIPLNPSWIEECWFKVLSSDYLGGANMVMNIFTYNHIGGFREDLETGEDYDLCMRVKRIRTDKLILDEGLKAIHHGYPKSTLDFIRREIWHGVGDLADFRTFLGSKVAVVSMIHFSLIFLAFYMLIIGYAGYSLIFFVTIFLINLGLTLKRFGFVRKNFHRNIFLNFLYLTSRFCSIAKCLKL